MTVQDVGSPDAIHASSPAKGDFPQNIDPVVTVQRSREVLEDYLMTSMLCKPVLQNRNFFVLFLVFSSEICLRGIRWCVCFPGVTAVMSLIPWNAPLPSIVMMLWSTLSAANRTDISRKSTSLPRTPGSTQSAAFFSNLITSVYDEQNPNLWRVSTMIFERYR